MAIEAGMLLEIVLNTVWLGQAVKNVFQYEVETTPPGVDGVAAANAWWNDVKDTYRALSPTVIPNVFNSVIVRELNNPAGILAEYSIPTGERAGTRAGTSSEAMPSFNAVGVRFTVGARTTRPGQKRLAYMLEEDQADNNVQPALLALVTAWATNVTSTIITGAPAIGLTLIPIVVSKDPLTGNVIEHQPVLGFVVNPYVTSQNSRKRRAS